MKMQLTLRDHSVWYGDEIKKCFDNAVWMFLNDEKFRKKDLEIMVREAFESSDSFSISLDFKSGAGKSTHLFRMEEYKG